MKKTFYYNAVAAEKLYDFAIQLNNMINELISDNQEIIYLCIGSDRSTGDSLGPLVGYRLSALPSFKGHVYGTLKNPVHAVNLSQSLDEIYSMHEKPFIIAIDASLGTKGHIGCVTLTNAPLKPGLGVKKSLPSVGDISVTGIVGFSGVLDTVVLQTTRLSGVMELSNYIAGGILLAAHMEKTARTKKNALLDVF